MLFFCTLAKVLYLIQDMNLLLRILLTAGLVLIISNFLPGVHVDNYSTSIIVAIVLGLLNIFIKPILVFFTLPVTILSLGLFLLVINAIIILLCDNLVQGFDINNFFTAFIFSILMSISQSVLSRLLQIK